MSNKVSYAFVAQDLYSKVAKKVTRVTDKLRVGFNKLNKATIAASARIRKSLKPLGKDLVQLSKRLGLVGLAAAALTVKFGAGFQDAMADVSAITGAVGKDLKFFSDESLRLAKSSATAQSEVAGAFKAVASAKSELLKDPKGLSNVVEQVLLLKNASGIELAEAVQVGVGALNQFNVGADQAARFVNVLAAGSKVGASEVRDTGLALKEAATVAKQNAGLSFEELNSTIQVLAKSEIKGGKAGTALKNVLLGLETSGKKKLMPSVVGINKALENLDKMNLNAKESIKLFGREGITAAGILIKNRRTVEQWTKAMTGTNSATEQANKRMATFSTKLRRLGIIIKDVLIKVFLRLEPQLTKIVERLSAFISKLKDKDIDAGIEKFNKLIFVVVGVGSAIKTTFVTIGTFIGETIAKIVLFIEKVEAALIKLGILEEKQRKATPPLPQLPPSPSIPVEFLPPGEVPAPQFLPPGVPPVPSFIGEKLDINAARSQTDINVNLAAPEGTINSVQSRTRGNVKGLNIGLNMVPVT